MRKVLNVLQSTAMANDVVDETSVYMCTGEPLPADIKDIVTALMNASFEEAYDCERSHTVDILAATPHPIADRSRQSNSYRLLNSPSWYCGLYMQ